MNTSTQTEELHSDTDGFLRDKDKNYVVVKIAVTDFYVCSHSSLHKVDWVVAARLKTIDDAMAWCKNWNTPRMRTYGFMERSHISPERPHQSITCNARDHR